MKLIQVQASAPSCLDECFKDDVHAHLVPESEAVGYASEDYQALLAARGIVCRMSRRGNCHDNAVMESFFSSVTSETADRFDSCGEAKMALFDYIEVFYNQRRRHSTIGLPV